MRAALRLAHALPRLRSRWFRPASLSKGLAGRACRADRRPGGSAAGGVDAGRPGTADRARRAPSPRPAARPVQVRPQAVVPRLFRQSLRRLLRRREHACDAMRPLRPSPPRCGVRRKQGVERVDRLKGSAGGRWAKASVWPAGWSRALRRKSLFRILFIVKRCEPPGKRRRSGCFVLFLLLREQDVQRIGNRGPRAAGPPASGKDRCQRGRRQGLEEGAAAGWSMPWSCAGSKGMAAVGASMAGSAWLIKVAVGCAEPCSPRRAACGMSP